MAETYTETKSCVQPSRRSRAHFFVRERYGEQKEEREDACCVWLLLMYERLHMTLYISDSDSGKFGPIF
jgi:hypothetical protein